MSQWIAGISRGHNASICLLKDGEIVFSVEEERLTRYKYDGAPYASMIKILDYTDKIDYLVVSHTQEDVSYVDYRGGGVYHALASKLRLIDGPNQVLDMHKWHHKMHAACAFYRSGFEDAVALIVDGAGTFIPMVRGGVGTNPGVDEEIGSWELESIFDCSYPDEFKTLYKHQGGRGPWPSVRIPEQSSEREGEEGTHELIVDDSAGIVKCYEAVTQYCGWAPIEAGKTMGLFPYGGPSDYFPDIYTDGDGGDWKTGNRELIIPTYPNGAIVNQGRWKKLDTSKEDLDTGDLTILQNRRDLAYAIQTESQQMVLDLIRKAVKVSGRKNVVLSGGYGLNCVANYWYLDQLKDEDINFYVEPISNDAGTAMGAALLCHYSLTKDKKVRSFGENLCLGPNVMQSEEEIFEIAKKYNATGIYEKQYAPDAVKLILKGNIVTLFQDRCENGPRALGNRSILYDPRGADGKDFVNSVKKREYFRPFAGSILHEHAHEWFDMRGMEESPHMMYAMNCSSKEYADQIPAIIHIDGTCRIQTVKEHQNPIYYEMIDQFYKETGVPILFNTSFNLAGEPLVETIDDALRTLQESELEYLYIPEKNLIIEVANK
jgi:carbamoyltransferase